MAKNKRIEIRPLLVADAAAFQKIRVEGLLESPTAFGSSYEEEVQYALSTVEERLEPDNGRAVFGAFDGAALVVVTGIRREKHLKLMHKTTIWGVYVTTAYRGIRVGRRLIESALECARSMKEVWQTTLTVTAANASALTLYLSLGFVEYGHEPDSVANHGEYYDEKHLILMF